MTCPVITISQLQTLINDSSHPSSIRVLDATRASDRDGYNEFKQEHIPGALWFDFKHESGDTSSLPNNIPAAQSFQDYVRSFGIHGDTHVIIYDNCGKGGMYPSGRVWYLFRRYGHKKVSVLNGGLQAWKEAGLSLDDKITQVESGNFTAKVDDSLMIPYSRIIDPQIRSEVNLVDTRPSKLFKGSDKSKNCGFLHGSVNIPLAEELLVSDQSKLKNQSDLLDVLKAHQVSFDKPLVSMCNSGMSSTVMVMIGEICGFKENALFHGGIIEILSRNPELVETKQQ